MVPFDKASIIIAHITHENTQRNTHREGQPDNIQEKVNTID